MKTAAAEKSAMEREELKEKMRRRVDLLNRAARAYYTEDREEMSNREYDRLYDELQRWEEESGIVLAGSPTQQVGYETLSELPRERHPRPMLSLDKTKSVDELVRWLGSHTGLLSWKMDGLTVVLTYEDGRLSKAVTRGSGEVGEVITANARTFVNLPVRIPFAGRLVVRGEAFITYSDFARINADIPGIEARYKNPRNLCSGSVRQLSSRVTAERSVHFNAFTLAEADGLSFTRRDQQLRWLAEQGFSVVEYVSVTAADVAARVEEFAARIGGSDMPSDGLVLIYDDIAYGASLGTTAKFPRDAIAFKWEDETAETELLSVEWSPSRTGLINPVAVFRPVQLEGTTVSRASVHNVSIVRDLELGVGDRLTVYKANMIIPQIADNLTRSGGLPIPDACPACGRPTRLQRDNEVEVLLCENPDCPAKRIKSFSLFASRDALNIEGLSEATIEKLAGCGILREPADFFRLAAHRTEIEALEGMGEKSCDKLLQAAERARETTPARLLYGLGIGGIGAANARLIARHCGDDWEKMQRLTREELLEIDGVGEVLADSYVSWFADETNRGRLQNLLAEVRFASSCDGEEAPQDMAGMTVVITGTLRHFKSRRQLREKIEARGGKVAGSVSGSTAMLINNDAASASTKNRQAKARGVPIVTEDEFLARYSIAPEEETN
ncbi:MAG: NAD-dependent DNA ligase LigA [Anaerovoracaceae bacterium]|jgi:DNA ligase (NAD+)